ncbi:MAG TPA: hypothetical protein VFG34_00315 [Sphingopyxis sp.]|nr:hypothetical protein [Sphingopyxis sp.]
MAKTPKTSPKGADGKATALTPVRLRARHDGWTPERQVAFLESLAETGCVQQSAAHVGLSHTSAYNLRRRPEAQAFRLAWDAALDFAVRRLADAALSRAIHGVAEPIFYRGQQVGERRVFDERLTQFILRTRDPARFGKWREDREAVQHFDGPALILNRMANLAADSAYDGEDSGTPAPPNPHMLAAALQESGLLASSEQEDSVAASHSSASTPSWVEQTGRDFINHPITYPPEFPENF